MRGAGDATISRETGKYENGSSKILESVPESIFEFLAIKVHLGVALYSETTVPYVVPSLVRRFKFRLVLSDSRMAIQPFQASRNRLADLVTS
jgi:hypothetical protein